ncbi:unnamed protein product [Camellia sinensis]
MPLLMAPFLAGYDKHGVDSTVINHVQLVKDLRNSNSTQLPKRVEVKNLRNSNSTQLPKGAEVKDKLEL